jgi:hypothetical protein
MSRQKPDRDLAEETEVEVTYCRRCGDTLVDGQHTYNANHEPEPDNR